MRGIDQSDGIYILTEDNDSVFRIKQLFDGELGESFYKKHLPDEIVTEAVFSDGTAAFTEPPEPNPGDTVRIRIRTAVDNVDSVKIITGERIIPMRIVTTSPLFDFYEAAIIIGTENMNYYFHLERKEQVCFYCRLGFTEEQNCINFPFTIFPGFHTPDWAKGAVMYQIFVDRFCNGDVNNDVQTNEYYYIGGYTTRTEDWDKYPATMGVREFYGGDLAGILKRLDYLQDLGIEAIYLNPIFVSPSNHKYDIQDYDYIDPHFGIIDADGGELLPEGEYSNSKASKYRKRVTDKKNLDASNRLFALLTKEIHKRGMKVILDGVFNHCGSFNKWIDHEHIYDGADGYPPGAYESAESPYRSFFRFREDNWPDNESYEGWWGHNTLPKLNYEESNELEQYILEMAEKWLSKPYNIDGWRLDVAADLGYSRDYNHRFWKKFRAVVKKTNPEALILAEHYGDPFEWLQGDEWDSVMNYDAFMEPITWFLTGMEKHSDEFHQELFCNPDNFFRSMRYHMTRFPASSILTTMNELSNHDHSRFLTRTNRCVGRSAVQGAQAANEGINPAVMREAVVIQFTWPGAPTIYYGDEAGVCGWSDPDNRRTYPWGFEDKEMIRFHKEMIRLHKSYKALKTGSLIFLYGAPGVLAYGRFDNTDRFLILVNNNDYQTEIHIPAWRAGILEDEPVCSILRTNQTGFDFEAQIYQLKTGVLTITLEAFTAVVLKNMPQLF